MNAVIDACKSLRPHPSWQNLRNLPYDDLTELREWICRPFLEEPLPASITGLWFGLFNPIYDGEAVADLYVSGSSKFEANESDGEWATETTWWPTNRYSHSAVLAEIFRIAYSKNGLGNEAEYPLRLAYASLAVKRLLNEVGPSLVAWTNRVIGIAVGFDSGDFILLGQASRHGLRQLHGLGL